jgi:transposase-like protein
MPFAEMSDELLGVVLKLLKEQGFDGMRSSMETLMNAAMFLERQEHLGVEQYGRSEQRKGYANGFKPKTIKTRMGEVQLQIPQVRDSTFYPQSLERGMRSETALNNALAEMYVKGVSTRRVAAITETMCGFSVSSTQVSETAKQLDDQLNEWRNRRLEIAIPYLILDALYEKVRCNGQVVSCAVLIASGVDETGKRTVLGVSVNLSEHEVHWREFLKSLIARGLHGLKLITSDAHSGLQAALRSVFPGIPWQRCQFHLQQNAQAHVPKQSMKKRVAAKIRGIFNAPNQFEAERLLTLATEEYRTTAPSLAKWMEENIPEGLSVFAFPENIQRRLRTSNMVERLNREIRRRTRVVGIFPGEESCLRLISAVLVEISEEWEIGSVYLSVSKESEEK